MKELKSFDAVIGHDTLKELGSIIDIAAEKMLLPGNFEIPLLQHKLHQINKLHIRDKLNALLKQYTDLFQPADSKLPFTTKITAEIRTTDDNAVFTKSYPYPQALKKEVTKQIDKLLNDGIIRPSKSPYNAPVWVVPKKADASGEKKYRLVIDFRKLNEKTINDRYPIPDTSSILANLGNNKYYTTLDLASGFHQIPMNIKDIEKTAFSINNGKYEFLRLPFGLKNAPSIFQRVMDDVLRDYIGKICYVYIDDIIIFGKTIEEHLNNLETILQVLRNANFKIQPDKSEFIKTEVEFLGFIVSENGLKPNPKKVEAIQKYPKPTNLKELRMFLGLSGYYRRFIKDYAKLAKPLTNLLRGEDGHRQISKHQSKNTPVAMGQEAAEAFTTLKNILSSSDVLIFPNFEKPFILTTDASDKALGAVLSQETPQGERPITFISRTLRKSEENYAANEKEMLAIIWALDSLRNFLYGAKIKIYTDHQPLTYALSPKNNNSKLKRWQSFLNEHKHQMFYKTGKSNIVADALSRIQINSLTPTQHSADDDDSFFIPATEAPINVFRNQLIFKIGSQSDHKLKIIFGKFRRHTFIEPYYTEEILTAKLKDFLSPNTINGILTSEPIMGLIQEIYKELFNPTQYRTRFSQKIVEDISDLEEQIKKIKSIHTYAHRNAKENVAQLIKNCYFPSMNRKTQDFVKNCEICKIEKYDRHPQKVLPTKTPVPTHPGQIIHIDIFVFNQSTMFLSSIEKFSKFVKIKPIKSRAITHIQKPLLELLYDWGIPEMICMDNERTFTSEIITQQIKQLGVQIFKTPVHHSETNGQIERTHSTIREIVRCNRDSLPNLTLNDTIQLAVHKYNNTIHSFTKDSPKNIYTGVKTGDKNFFQERHENIDRVQKVFFEKNNKIPEHSYPTYIKGDQAYEKINTVSKRGPRYKTVTVKENHNTYIIDENDRKIHKCNLRKP